MLCRVCAEYCSDDVTVSDIFKRYDRALTIAETISELTGLKVAENDGLPRLCCPQCLSAIDSAVHIRRKCVESDNKLKTSLKSNTVYAHSHNHTSLEHVKIEMCGIEQYVIEERPENVAPIENLFEERDKPLHIPEQQTHSSTPTDDGTSEANDTATETNEIDSDTASNVLKRYYCCGCPMNFDTAHDLMQHSLSVHAPVAPPASITKTAQCNICYRWYKDMHSLQQHKLDRCNRPYQCASCGQQFSRPSRLAEHEKSHSENLPYPCGVCEEHFATQYARRKHRLGVHPTEENGTSQQRYTCSECGKSYATSVTLELHKKLHSDETPYRCEKCGNSFKSKPYYQKHMIVHRELYTCKYCNRALRSPCEVKLHERRHTGRKDFSCESCPKDFYTKQDLLRHQQIHDKKK